MSAGLSPHVVDDGVQGTDRRRELARLLEALRWMVRYGLCSAASAGGQDQGNPMMTALYKLPTRGAGRLVDF